jgi:hypothetical protein
MAKGSRMVYEVCFYEYGAKLGSEKDDIGGEDSSHLKSAPHCGQ